MKEDKNWSNWNEEKHYGDLFFKRATGQLPEMESSKSVSRLIKTIYQAGQKLLDVGCGGGHYLRSLRNIVASDLDYTGVDPTEYYLSRAREAWGDTAHFKQGTIFSIPVEDNAFDIVMCNNVVMHLPPEKIALAFQELFRVSRGHVVIRAMFGERNYLVREVLLPKDVDPTIEEDYVYTDFDLTGNKFRYFCMYKEDFFRQLGESLPNSQVEIREDKDWEDFDNTTDSRVNTATKTFGEFQLSGNLVLDWRYIILKKG